MLNIAIIGCGNVLEAYAPQCEKLARRQLARWTLACGRPQQEARARALGAPRFTTNAADVFGSAEIDLVLILASIPDHAALARQALQSGKHVVIEKPLATRLDEAAELVALARQVDRQLVCAPFTPLSPTFQTIGRRLRSGVIGRPCLARARYGWSGPWWSEWFYGPDGGCLFDLGVYCITSLTGLLGPARQVSAMMGVSIPEREINGKTVRVQAEDNAQITLEFPGGAFGTVMSGFTMQQYRSPGLEIYGTNGVLQMLGDDWDPDGYELWQNEMGCWQSFKETDPDWPWSDGLRHAVESIHAKTPPTVTPEHALHVLEILLKARQAAKEKRTIAIESTFAPLDFGPAKPGEAAHLMHDRTREHLPAPTEVR